MAKQIGILRIKCKATPIFRLIKQEKSKQKKPALFLKQNKTSLDALYSSDLQRAHQTAQEIAELFSLEITLTPDLREGHFGKLEGLTKTVGRELYGSFDYMKLPETLEAEPREKVVARIMNYLHTIVKKHTGQHIGVVTHGYAIGSLLTYLGHKELPKLTNCSIITLIYKTDLQDFALESIENA